MLELRPNCEACDADLPPDSPDARICSFECTFCAACVETVFGGVCPNCGGNLERRPIRPAGKLLDLACIDDPDVRCEAPRGRGCRPVA